MKEVDRRRLHYLDSHLIVIGLALFLVGMMNLFSATSSFSGSSYNFVLKQFIASMIGVGAITVILRFDYKSWGERSWWLYFIVVGLIVAVFGYGAFIKGSRRWIVIWGVSFQPSELMKPAIVLLLAQILHPFRRSRRLLNPKDTTKPFLCALLPTALIIMQPDLGTGLLIFLVSLSMLWFAGMEKKVYLIFFGVAGGLIVSAKFILKPYQLERIYAWFRDPFAKDASTSDAMYHIKQSLIAIGSGQFFGKGYMKGTQHKLMFVPEHHTDFIFTVFAEEWGFVGSVALFVLFAFFIARCIKISQQSKDELGSTIAFGMASIIYFQFAVNVLMTMQIMPVVGIPLPFISYGGSSLLSVLVSVGFLLNVSMRRYMF